VKVSTFLVVVPVVVIATAVALANGETVIFRLDPFSGFTLSLPLFSLVFLTFFLGVVLGGLTVWWHRTSSSRPPNIPTPNKHE